MSANMRIVIAIVCGMVAAAGSASIRTTDVNSDAAEPHVNSEAAEPTLVFTQVMFRHGNRTPDHPTFPTDCYQNLDFYPTGWGQLTKGGKRREYNNGQYLRKRYGAFLGDILDSEVMLVRSTDYPRTKNSASLVAAGLWPPAAQNQWGNGLGQMWDPVDLQVIPKKEDNLLYVWDAPCPAYDREFKRVLDSPKTQELLDSFSDLRKYLSDQTGMVVQYPSHGYDIYQALLGQKEFGLELPEWSKEVFPHRMEPFVVWYFGLDAYNEKLQKLRAGVLLNEMITLNIAAANRSIKPKGRKIILYSAHDTNLSALLLALGVFDYKVIPYGTMVMMELHKIPGAARTNAVPDTIKVLNSDTVNPLTHTESLNDLHGYGIKLFLRNSTWHGAYPLTIPNCDHLCPLDRFILLTSKMVIKDWQAECK